MGVENGPKNSYKNGFIKNGTALNGTVNNEDEFPVFFEGEKFDLKKFMRDHPGGVGTLVNYKGKSIVQAMEKFGHSNSAYHMLKDLYVVSENGRIVTKDALKDEEEMKFLEELEAKVDWSKALYPQLENIAPQYERWVNTAVYRNMRIFEHPLMESMTMTPWYFVPIFWVPIISYLMVTQFIEHVWCGDACDPNTSLSVLQYIFHLAVGLGVWTLVEYSLHRYLFHMDPGTNVHFIKLHFLFHGLHHKAPFDGMRLVFPPLAAFVLACIIYVPVWLTMSYPLVKLSGGLIGYLTYDMTHYYIHHGSPTDGTYFYNLKRYHSNHHFVNPDKAFGVSNNFWDHIFRTYVQLKKLGFSLRWR